VALLGTNGNGKSTLMKCVMGLLRPSAGTVTAEIDGKRHDLTRLTTEEIVDLGIALVPEGRRLFPKLTVEENLHLGAYRKIARAQRERNLKHSYDTFPVLFERRRQLAGSMSGGEQQMLAVARALARDVKLLLLDEPYEGLAPVIVHEIEKILEEVKKLGFTTIIVEQNAIAALHLSDRAIILDMGEVVFDGSAQEVIDNAELRHQYLAI
jgi:branched-chain amino acid transport system ATP-binding protein